MSEWISAARLRTLPLALSSIFMGSFLAFKNQTFLWSIFALACLTTILLQVLSNFANDYGDTQNGADNADRVGPNRTVQSGKITPATMFKAIVIMGFLTLFAGITLLYVSFGSFTSALFLKFLALGLLCILAAYTYTAGKKPYGYAGLGDISVFIFFGIIGVSATYFLFAKNINLSIILPSISCGALAAGVLNINNIRDIISDKKAGKITIPVRLGRSKAIIYHWFLLILTMFAALFYFIIEPATHFLFIFAFIPIILNGVQVSKMPNPDPLLKKLALTSLFFVLVFGFCIIYPVLFQN
jgi:1,4-dihydroxy-2-naphthoate polyprenyltransferase